MFIVNAVTVALSAAAQVADRQLTDAVAVGDKNRVILLLRNGVRPDDKSQLTAEGYTPLHIAVSESRPDLVELLVRAGAKLETRASNGRTALHRAAHHGCIECTRLLLEKGADASAVDNDGKTPIDLALEHSYSVYALDPVIAVLQEFLEQS